MASKSKVININQKQPLHQPDLPNRIAGMPRSLNSAAFSQITDGAWDVVIIGAGPAGSSAAISIATPELNVLLLDAKTFPRRKACGGCLNRNTIRLLRSLINDVDELFAQSVPLKRLAIQSRHRRWTFPMAEGVAVDRIDLDAALVATAQQRGVVFADGVSAKLGPLEGDFRTVEIRGGAEVKRIKSRCVVIASGLGNRTAAQFQSMRQTVSSNSRVGVEAVFDQYPNEYRTGDLTMAIGRSGYVGLTEISANRLHVAASVDKKQLQSLGPKRLVKELLSESGAPALPDSNTQWKGTPALTATARRIAEDRVFLVGDAAGYIEPFTGEGIRWALEGGIGVAPFVRSAVHRWDDTIGADWQRWHKRHIVRQQRLCRTISAGLKNPAVTWLVHQLLRLRPSLATKIIQHINS